MATDECRDYLKSQKEYYPYEEVSTEDGKGTEFHVKENNGDGDTVTLLFYPVNEDGSGVEKLSSLKYTTKKGATEKNAIVTDEYHKLDRPQYIIFESINDDTSQQRIEVKDFEELRVYLLEEND